MAPIHGCSRSLPDRPSMLFDGCMDRSFESLTLVQVHAMHHVDADIMRQYSCTYSSLWYAHSNAVTACLEGYVDPPSPLPLRPSQLRLGCRAVVGGTRLSAAGLHAG